MKMMVFAAVMVCACSLGFSKGNIFVQGKEKLPLKAQIFIDDKLAKERIVYVKESRTLFLRKEYLAVFATGLKIEFDNNGNWIDMESAKIGLPQNIIPEKIWQYVKEFNCSVNIVEIEKIRHSSMRVLLSNKRELFFDKYYNRMEIDV